MNYYKVNTLCNHCPGQKKWTIISAQKPKKPLPALCNTAFSLLRRGPHWVLQDLPGLGCQTAQGSHRGSKQRHLWGRGRTYCQPSLPPKLGAPGQCRVIPRFFKGGIQYTKFKNTSRLTFFYLPPLHLSLWPQGVRSNATTARWGREKSCKERASPLLSAPWVVGRKMGVGDR